MSFSIIGTGSAVPLCIKTNDDLSKIVETSDEWIVSKTGIKQRHIITSESLTDLALSAAEKALENAGVSPCELDLIICATICGDYFSPSLSCVLQGRLNASCPAFDINAACTGFIYAMDVAQGYFIRKKAKKVLIVCADTLSRLLNWEDKATCVLFGDGAGAAVLGEGDDILALKLSCSGNESFINIPFGGNNPFSGKSCDKQFLNMKGQDVYKFAVNAVCSDLTSIITEAGLSEKEIDYVLLHQANMRIINAAKEKLSIPHEKYLTNIERYGNMSAASIPVLMDEYNKSGKLKKGNKLALSAFGAGLVTGACIINWSI